MECPFIINSDDKKNQDLAEKNLTMVPMSGRSGEESSFKYVNLPYENASLIPVPAKYSQLVLWCGGRLTIGAIGITILIHTICSQLSTSNDKRRRVEVLENC